MAARDEILARVRAAAVPAVAPVTQHAQARQGDVDTFAQRLADYRAAVKVCDEPELSDAIGETLAGAVTVVVPPGLPEEWLIGYPMEVVKDGEPQPLTAAELDAAGVSVLTGCAVAIAETGTLVLDAGPGQGRRLLTLVPDHHVCVVLPGQIMDSVPDALAVLDDPRRPLTLISGPSATSDIELDRVEGVHGPRRLDVIVVRHSLIR